MRSNRVEKAAFQVMGVAAVLFLAQSGMAKHASATPVASGYTVSFITATGPVAGDVVAAGNAVFVGVGAFGVGNQSIVRIDDDGITVLAEGFNSLGGMVYDAVNDRLLTGDNGGNGPGATTGDTIYAIPDPFGTPIAPASAADLELLPSGSIPGYADLVLDPNDAAGDTLYVTDSSASFPPNGLLLEVAISSGTTSVLQTGLAFSAGLASNGTSLFFGESLLDFSGQVSSVPLASATDMPALVAAIASGQFDVELSSDGTLITSAGGSLVKIDPSTGGQTLLASGFGFAAGLFEDDSGIIYALDGFASAGEEDRIWLLTPIPEPSTALSLSLGLVLLALRRQSGSRKTKRTGTATRP